VVAGVFTPVNCEEPLATEPVHFSDMAARLVKAGNGVRDAREAYDDARESRDQLIVEAGDQGMPQRAIARAAGVSQQRIVAIVLTRTGFIESAAG
jgi:hypothetical protein